MRSPRTARKSSPRSPQLEKARAQQQRLKAAKKKKTLVYTFLFEHLCSVILGRYLEVELLGYLVTLCLTF